ncbi:inhibitor of growth protein 2 isoform X1 [Columba livia]|uniref:Inhibitor of growth protein n=1 Tax=Columba livia TaxID=8932 RepID=A0A2I0MMH8_COLLI|nr:inhibitor of growth protein 2 [Columba livia]PKK30888.1 inhibitor of growth family, member 2 [Columba livia]
MRDVLSAFPVVIERVPGAGSYRELQWKTQRLPKCRLNIHTVHYAWHSRAAQSWNLLLLITALPPNEALKEIDDVYEKYKSENDPVQKKRLQQHLQRALINSQELGDEKIQIVTQMLELVENRARQMETHSQCFQDLSENEKPLEKAKMESCQPERSSRRPRRQRTSESRDLCHIANGIDDCDDQPPKEKRSKSSKKKKRSKAKQEREVSPVEFAIDPNEPTYCLCNQVSYGEMIGCDNEQCPIEWFHFSCVGLTYKPKGKWYCPKCRGDNEKTMDKCTDKSKKDRRSR